MNCTEFESLLSDFIDGNLGGSKLEEFDEHLSECALCSMLLDNTEEARSILSNIPEAEPSEELFQKIIFSTSGRKKDLRSKVSILPTLKSSLALKVAASVLFVLFLFSVYYNKNRANQSLDYKTVSVVNYFDYAGNRVLTNLTRAYISVTEIWEKAVCLKDEVENFFQTHWEQVRDFIHHKEKSPENIPKDKRKNKSTLIINIDLKNA